MRQKKTTPQLHKYRNRWRITWWRESNQFAIYLKTMPISEARTELAKIKLAIRGLENWPEDYRDAPGVLRFLGEDHTKKASADIISEYIAAVKGSITPGWTIRTESYISQFDEFCQLLEATPEKAQKYLAKLLESKAVNTRNKHLIILSKFYKWANLVHKWPKNPFAGIKQIRRVRVNTDIKYLSRDERDQVLAAALNLDYGLSIWIALYAGLRRNEIWRLRWEAINFESETLVAQSKCGDPRTVPVAPPLLEQLKKARKPSGLILKAEGGLLKLRSTCQNRSGAVTGSL